MVVRVLMALRDVAMAKSAMLASQRSIPVPWPGPAREVAESGG
jgi:hypothetical protein